MSGKNPRPRPLESFDPKLMQLLLRGTITPQVLYAERDKSAPELRPKSPQVPVELLERTVNTRWHQVVFADRSAALRFREFMRIAQRLHSLRATMAAEKHPDVNRAYSVTIGIDDRTGTLNVRAADSVLDELLDEAITTAPNMAQVRKGEEDDLLVDLSTVPLSLGEE